MRSLWRVPDTKLSHRRQGAESGTGRKGRKEPTAFQSIIEGPLDSLLSLQTEALPRVGRAACLKCLLTLFYKSGRAKMRASTSPPRRLRASTSPPLSARTFASWHEQLHRATRAVGLRPSDLGKGGDDIRQSVLSPGDLDAIQRAMEEEGTFEKTTINTAHLEKFRQQDGTPPPTITWDMYDGAMGRVKNAIEEVARQRAAQPIFLIRASAKGGGYGGYGDWYCKSHVYTFMLYRRAGLVPRGHGLLLVSDQASSEDLYAAIPAHKRDRWGRLLFVHLLDGVYSGLEARSLEQRCVKSGRDSFLLAATISRARATQFYDDGDSPRLRIPDTHFAAYDGELPKTAARPNSLDTSTIMVVGLGVLIGKFVLPFKIPDWTSVGVWSQHLEDGNRGFTPPYKRHRWCQDGRAEASGEEEHAPAKRLASSGKARRRTSSAQHLA